MIEGRQGDGLRAARIKAGITQEEVARRAGISVRTVRHVERGQVRNPRHETLARMAQVVGCDLAAALGREPGAVSADEAGIPYEIRLLGPLAVACAGLPVAMPLKLRSLLGLLAVQPDQIVSHEEIADVLWSGETPPGYAKLVHTYVARLRRIFEPRTGRRGDGSRQIGTVRGGYVFNSGGARLDLRQFEERIARATRATASDPVGALELYGQALRSRQGRLLQDVPQLWQHPAAVRVAQRHIDVAIEFADLALRLNRPAFAVEQLTVAAHEEPLHEPLQARMMLALAGSGRRAAALRLFSDLRTRLRKELGVAPSGEVWQARDAILRQEGPDRQPETGPPGLPPPGRTGGCVPSRQSYGGGRGSWRQEPWRGAPQQPYGGAVEAQREQSPPWPSHGGGGAPWNEPPSPSSAPSPSRTSYGGGGEARRESPPGSAGPEPGRTRGVAPPAQLPPVVTPFIGRLEQLAALDGLLAYQRKGYASVGIGVVHGPHEIGKTALAVRWAHHRQEEFPDGQLYADLRGSTDRPVPTRTVLTGFLRALGVSDEWLPDTLEEASALFRSLVAGRHFLVVLDDVADAEQVRALLPGTPGNLVVVTSRAPLMDLVAREGATPVGVDVLSVTESYALIEAYLGPERTAAERAATAELAAVCGQHPLALRTAAARLAATPQLSLRVRVAELARSESESFCPPTGMYPSVTGQNPDELRRSVRRHG